ncbi:MAG TPA: glycosyltransferase family 2 protein [Paludibacteraceae bacterium]|nr:glycosyltransferase family 2 protein [Paludibacteraceae bacterium]
MKISIITINYNHADGLRKTIESVINQTYQDFEYIIIDGGSTDGSVEVIKEYADHIHYWISEPDKGVFNAMNKGISNAHGEYCLFLNSGDYLYSEDSLNKFIKFNCYQDIVIGKLKIVNNQNDALHEIYEVPDEITAFFLFKNYVPHPSTFIKRELLLKSGKFNEDLKIIGDWEFFLRTLTIEHASWTKINAIISSFVTDGLSSSKENQVIIEKEKEKVLKTLFPMFIKDFKNYELLLKNKESSKEIAIFNLLKRIYEYLLKTSHKIIKLFK